jgi:Tfp pilus assembly protein PilF
MLGVLCFNDNRIPEAKSSLETSVRLDPSNAKARHYLGIIASRQGDEKAAESELATAVSLDPTYASAHFNLAVLYATMTTKNWDKSREHYLKSIAEGTKRDGDLEKLLSSKFPDILTLVEAELKKRPTQP